MLKASRRTEGQQGDMITVLLPEGTSSGLAGSAGHSRHNMRESKSHLNWLIVRTSEGTQESTPKRIEEASLEIQATCACRLRWRLY